MLIRLLDLVAKCRSSQVTAMRNGRLLFSIHDVAPAFERQIELHLEHARPVVGERLAMLVVPRHWASPPLLPGSPFAAKLRDWAERGIEMFVHGWTHRDDSSHPHARDRLRAAHMTAGEGEFLGLGHQEAAARIARGKALVEDIIGRPAAGFVAPAWLYGSGAQAALAESGLPLAEDHFRIWSPGTSQVLLRGPVITWASRSPWRIRSSLLVGAAARVLPLPATIRVAVHPGDTREQRLMRSIRSTLAALARGRRPAAYRELLTGD